jgi:NAD(P)-dependent dehydrogenase (short-subunit alcohol dehydrogenase family)
VRLVIDRFGCLNVLVNNAGVIQVAPVAAMTADDFADAHDTMFWGMLHPTFAALPYLRAGGHARIINITSIGGKTRYARARVPGPAGSPPHARAHPGQRPGWTSPHS